MPRISCAAAALVLLAAAACSEPAVAPRSEPPTAESDELLACPDGTMNAICNSQNSLAHVYNEHCTHQPGKSEWDEAYCDNPALLAAACAEATTDPAASDGGNCFAWGEPGETVGQTSAGVDTNCYKVVFTASGFGQVTMTTMFPVAEHNC